MKSSLLVLLSVCLVACQAMPLNNKAKTISLVFDRKQLNACQAKGEVIGSQGDLVRYWITSDEALLQGAINDLKNKTVQLGGSHILLHEQVDFSTSATLLGEVYLCQKAAQ